MPPSAGFQPPAAPKKKSRKALFAVVFGAIGVLVIAAVVMVLVFFIFTGGDEGPEVVVRKYFDNLKEQETDVLIGMFDPEYLEEHPGLKEALQESAFSNVPNAEVTGLELEAEVNGDNAKVNVKKGTLIETVDGEKEEYDLSEKETSFSLVKKGGKWYLTAPNLNHFIWAVYFDPAIEALGELELDASGLTESFTDLNDYIYESPESSIGEAQSKLDAIEEEAEAVEGESEETSELFKDFSEFEDIREGYPVYEEAVSEYIDIILKGIELRLETYQYIIDNAAAREAGTPVDETAYDAYIEEQNTKVEEFDNREAELYGELLDLEDELAW